MNKILRLRYKVFPIVIEPAGDGYFAYTDVLQGAHAEGATIGEAIDNLQDVIEKHLEIRKENGESIPSLELREKPRINIPLPMAVK